MLSEGILKISPRFIRFYRYLLIDKRFVMKNAPETGKLLDFGCGVGIFSFEIGRYRPHLSIISVDNNRNLIDLAKRYHQLDNIEYRNTSIELLEEKFECILVVDVFHHLSDEQQSYFFKLLNKRLKKNGTVIFVEPHSDNFFSYFMDMYVARDPPNGISLSEMKKIIRENNFKIELMESKYRGMLHSYYMILSKK